MVRATGQRSAHCHRPHARFASNPGNEQIKKALPEKRKGLF